MVDTTMQIARESFLKNHFLSEESLNILNNASSLDNLIIQVEAFDDIEKGKFLYDSRKREFSLCNKVPFFARKKRPCDDGFCPRGEYDTCVVRFAGESRHPFERFLQLCLEGTYELISITQK